MKATWKEQVNRLSVKCPSTSAVDKIIIDGTSTRPPTVFFCLTKLLIVLAFTTRMFPDAHLIVPMTWTEFLMLLFAVLFYVLFSCVVDYIYASEMNVS